ncbi:MAG: DUF1822 family protein [Brasilonema angustatum HA4187-MV1]|jgi:hypothetical protein|nr:DUF1822 family protein [Brasilonema angustatum HA4187-MV1]
MIDQPASMPDLTDLLDWRSLNDSQTELSSDQLQTAARLSQSIHLPDQRWQVYLAALAVLGFEQWLSDRAPDLRINSTDASIWQPAYANLIAAVCNVQVDSFKLCIVASSNLDENQVSFPSAVFDIPDFAAHFYVPIQVEEEEQQVAVSGFLNYEQYCRYQAAASLQLEQDWTYTLPLTWFNSDPNALLLNLRCLEPDAIVLPTTSSAQQESDTVLRQKLTTLQSQLVTKPVWELLTVEEGKTLLQKPELVNWVYEVSAPPRSQPLINVGLWLRNQLDTVAEELGWMLMPSLTLSGLRSLEEDFYKIRTALEQQGVHIPATARGAYRDLRWEQGSLRLYAVTWVVSQELDSPEWMLLIALSPQQPTQLSMHLKLEIKDETQLLFEQSQENTNQDILYAQVIGNWGERFWVTVSADHAVFEIPPFGFELEITP